MIRYLALISFMASRLWSTSNSSRISRRADLSKYGNPLLESPHFQIYGTDLKLAEAAKQMVEGAYSCYVETLGWRSNTLSNNPRTGVDGPLQKTKIYTIIDPSEIGGAAGVMSANGSTGMAYVLITKEGVLDGAIIHEYGHALHYHQESWVDQGRTGAWWETLAEWVMNTFFTSPLCATAREGIEELPEPANINVQRIIGYSYQVLVDASSGETRNYYEAWPFFTYLTNNPDGFAGLGQDAVLQLMVQYSPRSNETPLHTLQRISTSASVAQIVGKYWARMAYLDIGHPEAQDVFFAERSEINYSNVDSVGSGKYIVKSLRSPRYMGANINPPKKASGVVTVKITSKAQLTSHLVARNLETGSVRYVQLLKGKGSINVQSGEEASLVVANTPSLALFDPFLLDSKVNAGAQYSFKLSGATV